MDLETDLLNLPPHSTPAEEAVLGTLLLDGNTFDHVSSVLIAADFYNPQNRIIFEHITLLISENKPADVVTVFDAINKAGKSDDVGGIEYINSLANAIAPAGNIHHYALIVRDKSLLRRLISASNEINKDAFHSNGREAQEVLDTAESRIFEISESHQRKVQGLEQINPIVKGEIEKINELYQKGSSDVTGLPTSFIDLDKKTGGLQNGELIIVAGRPSMGKTAFAMSIANNVAIGKQLPVAVFSMEMSSAQIVQRVLASTSRINHTKLRNANFTESDNDWEKLTQAVHKLNGTPLYVDETPALSSVELRARARRLARTCGQVNLIVVDYLQLMASSRPGENRATEISDISRNLKSLAKELNCPVIALSQLNRSVEQRPDKRPMMSDLRESGAIEQDADLILFIYRDEVYKPDSEDKGLAEIIIGKQRNGPTGRVKLAFLGEYMRFENAATSYDDI